MTGIPEVLRHEETGLMVAERDEVALSDACERLLFDQDLREGLVRNGRKLVEEYFDIDKNTAKMRSFFSEMTGMELVPHDHQVETCN